MRIPEIGVASAAMLAALAVGGAVPALAQDATEDPAPEQSEPTTPEERHAAMRTELAEALAAEFGLDAETVAAALEPVQTQMAEQRRAEHAARCRSGWTRPSPTAR